MSKAIVAGHLSLDISPTIIQQKNQMAVSDIFSSGKLIQINGTTIHLGGVVGNTGLALKKLGVQTLLFGKIGNDPFGKILCEILRPYDDGKGIAVDEFHNTSYSIVWALPGLDRIICHETGVNNFFNNYDIPEYLLQDVSLFHFGYPPLMKSIYQNEGEELAHIFQRMKDRKIVTSLDMALVQPQTEAGKIDWIKFFQRIIPLTDFFVPSFEELFMMLYPNRYSHLTKCGTKPLRHLDFQKECHEMSEIVLQMGCKVLLIKCGAEGLYFRSSTEDLDEVSLVLPIRVEEWTGKEGFQEAFHVKEVISAIGAGDTSVAAFLAAAMEGRSLQECVMLAAAEGACCVTSHDTLSKLELLDDLNAKIKKGWGQ